MSITKRCAPANYSKNFDFENLIWKSDLGTFCLPVWKSVEVKSKKYFSRTNFWAKIQSQLIFVLETPPLHWHHASIAVCSGIRNYIYRFIDYGREAKPFGCTNCVVLGPSCDFFLFFFDALLTFRFGHSHSGVKEFLRLQLFIHIWKHFV